MKRLLSISLLLIFFLPQILKICVVIDFKLNQSYIAKVLCINKDKPSLKCDGNCYLAKQLKKVENEENKDIPISLNEKSEITLFLPEVNYDSSFEYSSKSARETPLYKVINLHLSDYMDDIFHPPKLILS